MFLNLFISVRRSACFRRFFRLSSGAQKPHTQRQVFVRPTLLPAASLARLTAGSSIGLTNMGGFELLMMEGKPI